MSSSGGLPIESAAVARSSMVTACSIRLRRPGFIPVKLTDSPRSPERPPCSRRSHPHPRDQHILDGDRRLEGGTWVLRRPLAQNEIVVRVDPLAIGELV